MQRKVGRFSESRGLSPHRSDHAGSSRRLALRQRRLPRKRKNFRPARSREGRLRRPAADSRAAIRNGRRRARHLFARPRRLGTQRFHARPPRKSRAGHPQSRVAHRLAQKSSKALTETVQVNRESEGTQHTPAEAHTGNNHLRDHATGPKQFYRTLTARAASSTTIVSEISDCAIIPALAQRESTAVSVGEKAVLVLNARKR